MEALATSYNRELKAAPISANRADELSNLYILPENLAGLKILDLGGSQSNFCAYLVENGADAYSIDPLYSDLENLEKRRREHFLTEVEAILPDLKGKLDPNDPRFVSGLEKDESTQVFKRSIFYNPGRYISASFHALPFKDELFDIITSSYSIFGVATRDEVLLEAAFSEALRALKPGGTLQLIPVTFTPGLSEAENQNLINILRPFQSDHNYKLSFLKGHLGGTVVGRLAIEKLNK